MSTENFVDLLAYRDAPLGDIPTWYDVEALSEFFDDYNLDDEDDEEYEDDEDEFSDENDDDDEDSLMEDDDDSLSDDE